MFEAPASTSGKLVVLPFPGVLLILSSNSVPIADIC